MAGSGLDLMIDQWPVEVATRFADDRLAQLGAQRLRFDLLHRAIGKFAELERPEGDADQPVDLEPERFEDLAHLAIFALADGKGEPDIGALLAVERGFDRPVAHAIDGRAAAQLVEGLLRDAAERAHAIAAQP